MQMKIWAGPGNEASMGVPHYLGCHKPMTYTSKIRVEESQLVGHTNVT